MKKLIAITIVLITACVIAISLPTPDKPKDVTFAEWGYTEAVEAIGNSTNAPEIRAKLVHHFRNFSKSGLYEVALHASTQDGVHADRIHDVAYNIATHYR